MLDAAYIGTLDPHLAALSEPTTRDSIAGANRVTRMDPRIQSGELADAAADLYTQAVPSVFLASAAICALIAILVAARLPKTVAQQ
ncbi:hypothetical protein GCM10009764_67000 [Nocardia ninae]|uniref:Uncharacterized protein n=1 Tax=Nocardia ninae NBRC 108245 TaxID=1210091 RepID=A0A511M8F5_9NOCA|nr:hypothetical protein NN4_10060 [Nocardia ninae NBRC 108245]